MSNRSSLDFTKEFIDRVLELNADHQEALYERASIHVAEGEKEQAIKLLEHALKSSHENLATLRMLANLYTEVGRYADGLAIDRGIVRLAPDDAVAHYNLACSLALVDRKNEAFDELGRAIELGYDEAEHMREDPDLEGLRGDPRFEALLKMIGG